MTVAGRVYLTGIEVREKWPDVTPALLRQWCRPTRYRPPLVTRLTVAQLAAATGRPVPDGVDPGAPARMPGCRGYGANLYPLDELVAAELATRDVPEARRRPW